MGEPVSASVTRQSLPTQLDRVQAGERTRRTSKVWQRADEIGRRLEEARNQPLSDEAGLSAESAEELIRQIRADRDRD